jgi:uncharacterized membrane protein YdbT with pleckstrin-like domain
MARRILNRKELREETEAAERLEEQDELQDEETEEEEEKVKTPKKPPTKRKSRSKTAKEVRLKAFWGVFSQSMTPVVLFEYSQRKQADAKAKELSESKKTPHFVQLVKKVIEE